MEITEPLPYRQARVLRFVRAYVIEHGYAPSYREIGKASGLSSTSTVAYNLNKLAERGLITRLHGRQALTVAEDPGRRELVEQKERLVELVEEALYLRAYGEEQSANGGWQAWDRNAEAYLRSLMPAWLQE